MPKVEATRRSAIRLQHFRQFFLGLLLDVLDAGAGTVVVVVVVVEEPNIQALALFKHDCIFMKICC